MKMTLSYHVDTYTERHTIYGHTYKKENAKISIVFEVKFLFIQFCFRQSDTCIFCGRNHISGRCDIITKPEFREKKKKCIVCMKFGHVAQKCRT